MASLNTNTKNMVIPTTVTPSNQTMAEEIAARYKEAVGFKDAIVREYYRSVVDAVAAMLDCYPVDVGESFVAELPNLLAQNQIPKMGFGVHDPVQRVRDDLRNWAAHCSVELRRVQQMERSSKWNTSSCYDVVADHKTDHKTRQDYEAFLNAQTALDEADRRALCESPAGFQAFLKNEDQLAKTIARVLDDKQPYGSTTVQQILLHCQCALLFRQYGMNKLAEDLPDEFLHACLNTPLEFFESVSTVGRHVRPPISRRVSTCHYSLLQQTVLRMVQHLLSSSVQTIDNNNKINRIANAIIHSQACMHYACTDLKRFTMALHYAVVIQTNDPDMQLLMCYNKLASPSEIKLVCVSVLKHMAQCNGHKSLAALIHDVDPQIVGMYCANPQVFSDAAKFAFHEMKHQKQTPTIQCMRVMIVQAYDDMHYMVPYVTAHVAPGKQVVADLVRTNADLQDYYRAFPESFEDIVHSKLLAIQQDFPNTTPSDLVDRLTHALHDYSWVLQMRGIASMAS